MFLPTPLPGSGIPLSTEDGDKRKASGSLQKGPDFICSRFCRFKSKGSSNFCTCFSFLLKNYAHPCGQSSTIIVVFGRALGFRLTEIHLPVLSRGLDPRCMPTHPVFTVALVCISPVAFEASHLLPHLPSLLVKTRARSSQIGGDLQGRRFPLAFSGSVSVCSLSESH